MALNGNVNICKLVTQSDFLLLLLLQGLHHLQEQIRQTKAIIMYRKNSPFNPAGRQANCQCKSALFCLEAVIYQAVCDFCRSKELEEAFYWSQLRYICLLFSEKSLRLSDTYGCKQEFYNYFNLHTIPQRKLFLNALYCLSLKGSGWKGP